MCTVYGYARISTYKQNIERQISNILRQDSNAVIIKETYTGTTAERPAWQKLLRNVKAGDTIIFDEVSRMSRNAAEGFEAYTELYQKGVELVFIKEPYINTAKYKSALERQITLTIETGNKAVDKLSNNIIDALNRFLMDLARQDIETAFDTAQKEVDYLHKRTSEGVKRAQAEGKTVGRKEGSKIETKKAAEQKKVILKHSKDFGGSLTDLECMKQTGLSRNTFYKYKRELKEGR